MLGAACRARSGFDSRHPDRVCVATKAEQPTVSGKVAGSIPARRPAANARGEHEEDTLDIILSEGNIAEALADATRKRREAPEPSGGYAFVLGQDGRVGGRVEVKPVEFTPDETQDACKAWLLAHQKMVAMSDVRLSALDGITQGVVSAEHRVPKPRAAKTTTAGG